MCCLWNEYVLHSLHFFYGYETDLHFDVKYITHTAAMTF